MPPLQRVLVISDEIVPRVEAPGRSKSSAGTVGASPKTELNELSESQLEALLTEKRRQREEASPPTDSAQTSVVTASSEEANVVGPVVIMGVNIEGVPVSAMIDTGAQSTIISRATLHAVVRHLQSKNLKVPRLENPTVRLYG